jgi:hypothetical protein
MAERFAAADGIEDGFVVVNVNNGPGRPDDPYYGPALRELRATAPGLAVLGYVDLDYGTRTVEDVLDDAEVWRRRYGVNGVMLDRFPSEGPDDAGSARALEAVSRLRAAGISQIAGNPGTVPDPATAEALDVVCEFEGTGSDYAALSGTSSSRPGRWHLVHDCTRAEFVGVHEKAAGLGVDYLLVTDRALPHPWNGFPEEEAS